MFKEEFMDDSFTKLKYAERLLKRKKKRALFIAMN